MKPVILFLGDGSPASDAAREALAASAFLVRTPAGAVEALVELQTEHVDVVVCHSDLPSMKAVELLSLIQLRFANTGRILMTPKPDPELVARAINDAGIHRVLVLPASGDEVLLVVSSVADVVLDAREKRALLARAAKLTALAEEA